MYNKKTSFWNLYILLLFLGWSCQGKNTIKEEIHDQIKHSDDYIKPIPGEDEVLELEKVRKGEVLVAYSDCYDCHKEDNRAKGPAFQDIAKRYPAERVYIEHLARKIINGGTGAWGYPVMTPHTEIKKEDASAMATYILSLKSQ